MAVAVQQFAPEIDAKLYEEMVRVAKKNGQSQRYILEKALEHYLHNVVPSQHLVRRNVIDAFEQSVSHNRDLLERLAKQMAEYLTVAEVYAMQSRPIDLFGGLHGVRDKAAVEAAVFRPQTGYYGSIDEEAAALMESLANNHRFADGNKPIAFSATDTFLRINGLYLNVSAEEGFQFIYGSMDRQEFRYAKILVWIREHIKKLP